MPPFENWINIFQKYYWLDYHSNSDSVVEFKTDAGSNGLHLWKKKMTIIVHLPFPKSLIITDLVNCNWANSHCIWCLSKNNFCTDIFYFFFFFIALYKKVLLLFHAGALERTGLTTSLKEKQAVSTFLATPSVWNNSIILPLVMCLFHFNSRIVDMFGNQL